MNQKQLANVLIKILGLSMCAYRVSGIIDTLIFSSTRGNASAGLLQIILNLVPIAIGIFFIVRSRWLVEKLFKDEVE